MNLTGLSISAVFGSAALGTICLAQPTALAGEATVTSADSDAAPIFRPLELNLGALQDEPIPPARGTDDWRIDTNLWVWMLGLEGDVGVGGQTVGVSADFGDILDASDSILAFSGRVEVGRGRWAGFLDGIYSKLGVDDVPGPPELGAVDITFEMSLLDFGVMYRVGEWTPEGRAAENERDTTLDIYAGVRYTNLDLELDPATMPAASRNVDWFDPIVGGKLVLPFDKHWHLMANGDIGGFGVESDLTWSVTGVLGYDFRLFDNPATVYAGYRAIAQDFTQGSGDNEFTWDVVQHGPILGFSLFF